jgi:molybdopterin-biosynthesis enzyme MoeA-like protein
MAMMEKRYKPGEFNEARKRMALVPVGAELVANSVSTAPGVHIGNVFVMAGVPAIMRAMLDAIAPRLERGAPVHSATVQTTVPEGRLAAGLEKIQKDHKNLAIGSYPFYREGGNGVQLVARGRDLAEVEAATLEIEAMLRDLGAGSTRIS